MINENEQRSLQLEYLRKRRLRVINESKEQRNMWLKDKHQRKLQRVKNKREERANMRLQEMLQQGSE